MQMRIALSAVVFVLALCHVARAEQFVLVDVTYTHSVETTKDSHYYPMLPATTPKDWTSPVDYSKGSVHVVLDVKSKPPGDAPTKLQICFEGTPSYGCTQQSPTYTKAGRVEWDSPFSSFWYESTVDWSKGVKQSPLILKDDMNNKPHGDERYMPTELHVQVTLVAPGSTFVPPPAAGSGGAGGGGAAGAAAGSNAAGAGAGGRASGSAGASSGSSGADGAGASGSTNAGGSGASGSSASAGSGASRAGSGGPAGVTAGAASAGRNAAVGGAGSVANPSTAAGAISAGAGTLENPQTAAGGGEDDSGCRAAGTRDGRVWPFMLTLAALFWRRRRQLQRA